MQSQAACRLRKAGDTDAGVAGGGQPGAAGHNSGGLPVPMHPRGGRGAGGADFPLLSSPGEDPGIARRPGLGSMAY